MIPKKIHYFWFGGAPKGALEQKCIASWRKFCPDYEIVEWNESNYDVTKNAYMREAYQEKRWGFVSDYARLDAIFEHGGIYLDTDVELLRPLDELLALRGFIGFERTPGEARTKPFVNTGQGFGAEPGNQAVKAMRDIYRDMRFTGENAAGIDVTCPHYNTAALVDLGLRQVDEKQLVADMTVFPTDYFCPVDWKTQKCTITPNTYSIHHFNASWLSPEEKKRRRMQRRLDYIRHAPNMAAKAVLGADRYNALKEKLKGK